jgi:sugar (pentulose or hexulose) kinase
VTAPRPATRALLVGVDVGTTLTKAGLIDAEGRELGVAAAPTAWTKTPTGAEADAIALADAAIDAVRRLLATAPEGDIIGVGVTSMAETVILLDQEGEPVVPAVAWHDTRAAGQMAALNAELGAERVGRTTGLGTWQIPSVPVLRWFTDNRPETARATTALSVAEWVVHRLGGHAAAEASLASRTGALDIAARRWWSEALEWAGVATTLFPEVRPAGASWGRVTSHDPALVRIHGARLTVAGHDHACASVGVGILGPAQVMDSCGTAEAVIRPVPVTATRDLGVGLPDGISTGWHVLPDSYLLLGGRLLGLDLMRVLERLGATTRHGQTTLDAGALAGGSIDTASAAWLTACTGHVDEAARLLRSVERIGGPVEEVRLSGGWARNPVLRHLKAEAFPHPVYPDVEEAGIRGAALFAGQAGGLYRSPAEFPAPPLTGDQVAGERPTPSSLV